MPGGATTDMVIEVQDLARRFGDFWAVDGLDLSVPQGGVIGLLGPNGAGKSTTMRMVCGLLLPTKGHIRVAGVDPVRDPLAAKEKIGYMTQHFSLYADLTVVENLRFYGAVYGLRQRQLSSALERWLDELELDAYAHRPMSEMPPGWTRRAEFACAVMHDAPVLILDEPTSGVDLDTSDLLWRLCRELAEAGAAILVSTHFMAEAERCDRVNIMAAGRSVAEGTPQGLTEQVRDRILGVQATPLDVALAALTRWSGSRAVTVAGSWIRVEIEGDMANAVVEAQDALEQAGGAVTAVEPLEPTLDDVFLHVVTGREVSV